MIRVLVVDDEPPARENLRLLLAEESDVELVEECGSGSRAVAAIREHGPDVVFLDVQMPGMDGFDVIRAIGPERMPITVFVTAYDRYALRAFDAHALDYLLKPFDDGRFRAALGRARERLRERSEGSLARRMVALVEGRADSAGARAEDPAGERDTAGKAQGDRAPGSAASAKAPAAADTAGTPPAGSRPLTRLTVRERDRVKLLAVEAVDYFEAAGDYVRAHAGGRTHLLDDTMKALEAGLDRTCFVRIHRSHIVRIDRIRELEPSDHGDWIVRLDDGTELRLSRTRRATLERALGREL